MFSSTFYVKYAYLRISGVEHVKKIQTSCRELATWLWVWCYSYLLVHVHKLSRRRL